MNSHLDGFRFDATQNIYDDSKDHILAAITRAARQAAGRRQIYLIAENEPQETRIVRAESGGGYGMNGLWNDDFHHSALVRLSGHNEAYYSDFLGRAEEFVAACKWGYLYQGQALARRQKKRRGTPALDLPPTAFVELYRKTTTSFRTSAHGMRTRKICLVGVVQGDVLAASARSANADAVSGPGIWGEQPIRVYFADHHPELARLVRKGRGEFMKQFPSQACEEMEGRLPDPGDIGMFNQCRIDWSEAARRTGDFPRALSPICSSCAGKIQRCVCGGRGGWMARFCRTMR